MSIDFHRALAFMLVHEGGFVDDPHDPGGRTNFGITQRTYNVFNRGRGISTPDLPDVKYITMPEVEAIYEKQYWLAGRCDQLWGSLSLVHFDSCVQHGIKPAVKLLQRSHNKAPHPGEMLEVDGILGPKTLNALSAFREETQHGAPYWILDFVLPERIALYYRIVAARPESQRFLRGWMARVESLRRTVIESGIG